VEDSPPVVVVTQDRPRPRRDWRSLLRARIENEGRDDSNKNPSSLRLKSDDATTNSIQSTLGSPSVKIIDDFFKSNQVKPMLDCFSQLLGILELNTNTTLHHQDILGAISRVFAGSLKYKQKRKLSPVKLALSLPQVVSPLRVFIVGAGPVALRTAVQVAMTGNNVTVIERRSDDIMDSRPNILKLWEWTFTDLKRLGLNSADMQGKGNKHIGCDELQLALLRLALMLGVKYHGQTEYCQSVHEPGVGWIATCKRGGTSHPGHQPSTVSFPFDVIIGGGGANCRNKQEFGFGSRAIKLANATGLVCFFQKTDKPLEEVLWARQFDHPRLLGRMHTLGLDMENLVFFQGSRVNYLVCTPLMESLSRSGVVHKHQDLRHANEERLLQYARSIASLVGIPETAKETGRHPVSLFDFSERVESLTAIKVLKVTPDAPHGALAALVGDALIEPFWPEGSGINVGFHSALDIAWTLLHYRHCDTAQLVELREALFQAQRKVSATNVKTSLRSDYSSFGMDPGSRYTGMVYQAPAVQRPAVQMALGAPSASRTHVQLKLDVHSHDAAPSQYDSPGAAVSPRWARGDELAHEPEVSVNRHGRKVHSSGVSDENKPEIASQGKALAHEALVVAERRG
jgi:2-polyprenyl-6-methoxyphenol hydroxylase-like FAD-dependent oxidoreductase